MTDNELLLAMSDLLDIKLKSTIQSELQPLKDDIRDMKDDIKSLKNDVNMLKEDVSGLKNDVNMLKEDVSGLKEDVRSLNQRVTSLELHLENTTDRNIRILAENYVPAAKRYEKASAQIEAIQADVDVMKKVIKEHSPKLEKLA